MKKMELTKEEKIKNKPRNFIDRSILDHYNDPERAFRVAMDYAIGFLVSNDMRNFVNMVEGCSDADSLDVQLDLYISSRKKSNFPPEPYKPYALFIGGNNS